MATQISGIPIQSPLLQGIKLARPAAASATGTPDGSAQQGANIAANDFITLLVTEMKNQDPTANTDPNEYVNQLVQVNSLEQLISINQTLQTGLGVTGSSETAHARTADAGRATAPLPAPASSVTSPNAAGNLTVPSASPAAARIAQALAPAATHHAM